MPYVKLAVVVATATGLTALAVCFALVCGALRAAVGRHAQHLRRDHEEECSVMLRMAPLVQRA